MPRQIHQLLAVFDGADAQGVAALEVQRVLKDAGFDSRIYAETVISKPARPIHELPRASNIDDTIIYHYSSGSGVGEVFRRYPGRRILLYHNITPGRFFRGWDNLAMLDCLRGERLLRRFKSSLPLALTVSEFNARQLRKEGFSRVEVLPFPLVEETLSGKTDQSILSRYGKDDGTNILFVGRLAPNKKIEDIIRSFQLYRQVFNPESRLFLVGASNIASYTTMLRNLAGETPQSGIHITGKVSWEELRAYYRTADLFCCLSEHEGFCVPLIESMRYEIPVIAFAAAAIPETMGKAGILIDRKNPELVAGLINRVLSDQELKKNILQEQEQRLSELRDYPFASRLLSLI